MAAAAELEMVAVTEVEPAANMDLVNVSGVGLPAVKQSIDCAEPGVSFSESIFARHRAVAAEPAAVAGWGPAASVVLVRVAALEVPMAADAAGLACAGIWEVEVVHGPLQLRRPNQVCVGIIASVADRPFVGFAPVERGPDATAPAPSSTAIGTGPTGRQDTDDTSFTVQGAKVTSRPKRPVPT